MTNIYVLAGQRAFGRSPCWWSGAGSNRRPSAFQAPYRASRPRTRTFRCPAQRHYRWSAAIEAIVATVPRCAGAFRFVCGVSVGITGRARTCGDSVGPPQAAVGSSASLPPLEGPGDQNRPRLLKVTRDLAAHEPNLPPLPTRYAFNIGSTCGRRHPDNPVLASPS